MVSNVLAAAAVLRRHFRRLASMGLLGLLGAVGVVPLALYMPRHDGSRYVLLSLVCLYAGRKIVHLLHARAAEKQLSMEEHFIRYGSSGRRVQQCVQNEEHMWTKSGIVAGLKSIAGHRLPGSLMVDEKRQWIYRRYRQVFRSLLPRTAVIDSGLVAVIAVTMLLAPTISVDLRTLMFFAGFLALAVTGGVETTRWFVDRRLSEGLDRWFGTLSEWTLRECLEALDVPSGAYYHRLLYFTQPWFADGSDTGQDGDAVYVVFGDGGVLPAGLVDDEEG